MFQEKVVVQFWAWVLPILLGVAVFALIATLAFAITDAYGERVPVKTVSDGGVFVRGSAPAAWCSVYIVELEGHKYVVAVHTGGCAVCPAVAEEQEKSK